VKNENVTLNPKLEVEQMLAIGNADATNPQTLHLRSKLTILTYQRIANEISAQLPKNQKIALLDWGAGFGQMSYLLAKRGIDVTSFNYIENQAESFVNQTHYQFGGLDLPLVTTNDSVKLPFPDQHFDVVLSCGVLEHVENERGSLAEVRRVLKPQGFFFVYQLPQKGSWLEFIIGKLKLGYVHERKYSGKGIRQLLSEEGFNINFLRRANMLPKNFTGMPSIFKKLFEKQPQFVLAVDKLLARVPGLNLISGIFEITARKR
jgi:2-polyprenyl-3-methyl-5-hydroxy-6-metoxy-1,4-benzoquinol methylase